MISVRKGEYVVCSFLAAILRPNLYSRTVFPTEPIHHSHFHPVGDLTAPQDLTCSLKNACNLFYKILHRKNTNAIIHWCLLLLKCNKGERAKENGCGSCIMLELCSGIPRIACSINRACLTVAILSPVSPCWSVFTAAVYKQFGLNSLVVTSS